MLHGEMIDHRVRRAARAKVLFFLTKHFFVLRVRKNTVVLAQGNISLYTQSGLAGRPEPDVDLHIYEGAV